MSVVAAGLIAVLFAAGTYLVLRRDLVRVVWGLALFGQGANLTVITMGGLTARAAPIVGHGHGQHMDPLVQALILTAVVIGLGTTAFALVLTYRVYEENQSLSADHVSGQDELYGIRRSGGDGP